MPRSFTRIADGRPSRYRYACHYPRIWPSAFESEQLHMLYYYPFSSGYAQYAILPFRCHPARLATAQAFGTQCSVHRQYCHGMATLYSLPTPMKVDSALSDHARPYLLSAFPPNALYKARADENVTLNMPGKSDQFSSLLESRILETMHQA